MDRITGGKALILTLEACGVKTVFGIPGVHNIAAYQALLDTPIRHVTVRHEEGAGFMAMGYARASGKMAAALVISGPGLTNILTPMGEAYHDAIPMLVISSHIPTRFHRVRSGVLHELVGSGTMARAVAKESRMVTEAATIPMVVAEALHLAKSGRPGPVHVEIPLDLLEQEINMASADDFKLMGSLAAHQEMQPTPESLAEAAEVLKNAKRPVIIAGGGSGKAADMIADLAMRLDAPVLLTPAGKGTMDDTHPLCLGVRHHFSAVRRYIRRADVVLAVGTELPEDLYGNPFTSKGILVQIDSDPGNFEINCRADIGIHGDADRTVAMLLERLSQAFGGDTSGHEQVARLKEELKAELAAVFTYPDLALMLEMLEAMRSALPRNAILCVDSTCPGYVGFSEFPAFLPNTYIHPCGYGTLGMALPAAIGAKIASPDKAVCVLAGDGGFQFTMAQLGVACQERICLPVIIWDNGGFCEIRAYEEIYGFEKYIAVDHVNPDFLKLAAAYDMPGQTVRNGRKMETALAAALREDGPSIILVSSQSTPALSTSSETNRRDEQ